jgi:hypothetical protein
VAHQVLRLTAGHLAVELGVAEQGGSGVSVSILRRLALGVELALAHPAMPARDVERDHDAVALLELTDFGADLFDDAHRLVAQDVTRLDERAENLVEVQVRAAEAGRGDAHDRVSRHLDPGVRNVLDPDVLNALPGERFHD